MKKILMVVAALMVAICVNAQRIRIIDKDGQPVPYVSVMTADAKFIGVTDLDGVIADVKGADTISVSHVAYKPKLYKVNDKSGSITLEDADFGLPEIVVKKKPYVYVQTYYRMYMYTDDMGMAYYRVGLTDNVYDLKTKKLSTNTRHTSKARYSVLKTAVNTIFGSKADRISHLRMKKIEDNIKKNKDYTIVQEGANKKHIKLAKGTIGYIVDENGQRRFSYDAGKIKKYDIEEEGNAKKKAKAEKKAARKKNEVSSDFVLYRIDEEGNYLPEDFVMLEHMDSYDEVKKDNTLEHTAFGFQVFAIERAYVDKEDLKKLKKENKMKLTYQNIRQFERAHKIPALAPNLQQKLNELWKSDESE